MAQMTLDQILQTLGMDKYNPNVPASYQTGQGDGYHILFDAEPTPSRRPELGVSPETGTPTWNGYGVMGDGAGNWSYNPSGIEAIPLPFDAQAWLRGQTTSAPQGRSYASGVSYIPDYAAALKAADNGGIFADYPIAPLLPIAASFLAPAMAAGAGGATGSGVGSINPALAESFAANYAPEAWAAASGGTAAGAAGSLADLGYIDPLGGLGGGVAGGVEGATGASIGAGGMEAGLPAYAGTAGEISPSLLSQLNSALGTSLTSGDVARTLGSLGAAGLGAYASNQQTNALEAQAQRYEGYGAPYRQRLSDLYANPDSFLKSKEVTTPVDLGTQSLMRSLSTQGNPFGSGNALQQGQSYASDQLFSRLGQEKDRLAGFGGLSSYNQAAPQASTNAINSSSNAWNAAGSAANNIFNPPQTPAQQAAEWMKVMGR